MPYSMDIKALQARRRRVRQEIDEYRHRPTDELQELLRTSVEQLIYSRLRVNALDKELRHRGERSVLDEGQEP